MRGKRRSRNRITYHGRVGFPVIHATRTGRRFVMVRSKGGGTKRLYEGSQYNTGRNGGGQTVRLRLK